MKTKAKNTPAMGIEAGLTEIFNISRKLQLFDPIQVKVNDVVTGKKVQHWIENNPELIFHYVYNTGQITLAKDAHAKLMESLNEKRLDLWIEIQNRKTRRKASQNIQVKLRQLNMIR